tara:strand:- start:243 stop:578 length:336 start_codon:yes stop_codon:yes gene_type:complete
VKKMSNVVELETMLKEQVEAGLITDFELRRIMSRATGGVYLDESQQEQFNLAKSFVNETLETLTQLNVVSEKRLASTRKKMEKAIVKHITNGGTLSDSGKPLWNNNEEGSE